MGIGFTAAVAGRRDAHQTRIEFILHVAFQDAVFDQHIVLTRRAFIIDSHRATTVDDGAVVHDGAQLRGD